MAVRRMLVAGRYRLQEPVGAGGMGRVWMARDEMLDRDVAVKEFVPPEWMTDDEKNRLRNRTLREARSAARLNHPHVVRIYDVVHADGLPWIVMEYVASRSLHQVIAEDGPFTPGEAARIGLDVLDALTAAHRAGVLHRDVKPHNVLIGNDGRVVLTDFGLATFVDDGSVTGPGLIVGSPQYVSPERARDGASTVESDLWSLGATLYAAVEGRSPYARESAMATLMALATEPPDPPVAAGPLTPVLDGLLRREPCDRLTAGEVEEKLREIVTGGRTSEVRSAVPAQRPPADAAVAAEPNAKARRKPRTLADVIDRAGARPASGRNGSPVTTGEPGARRANQPPVAVQQPVPPQRRASGWPARRVKVPDSPISVPPAGPAAGRGRSTFTLIGLLAFVLLAAGGIAAGYLVQRDDERPPQSAGPISSGAPSATTSRTAAAGSGGFSPLVCAGEPAANLPRTPQPGAARTKGSFELLRGFSMYTDATGFQIAVPDGWTYERIGTTVCFRDPAGIRTMSLDSGRNPAGDPVQACRKEADRLIRAKALPQYEEIGITREPLAIKAAEWEYTYQGPNNVRMHAATRWFVSAGKGFALGWSTRDFDWTQNTSAYWMIRSTFAANA